MGTKVIIVGMVLFVLWVIVYSTGYMLEMILYPEEIAREYWNEYWEREDADGEDKES